MNFLPTTNTNFPPPAPTGPSLQNGGVRKQHGLQGRRGNNQTKKGANRAYVITPKQLRDRLVRQRGEGGEAQSNSQGAGAAPSPATAL